MKGGYKNMNQALILHKNDLYPIFYHKNSVFLSLLLYKMGYLVKNDKYIFDYLVFSMYKRIFFYAYY